MSESLRPVLLIYQFRVLGVSPQLQQSEHVVVLQYLLVVASVRQVLVLRRIQVVDVRVDLVEQKRVAHLQVLQDVVHVRVVVHLTNYGY